MIDHLVLVLAIVSLPQQLTAPAGSSSFGTRSRAFIVFHSLSSSSHGKHITRAHCGDADAPPHLCSERRGRSRRQRRRPRRLRRSRRLSVFGPHPLDQPADGFRRCAHRRERRRLLIQRRDACGQGASRARSLLDEPPQTLTLDHPTSAAPRPRGSEARPCVGVRGGSACMQ